MKKLRILIFLLFKKCQQFANNVNSYFLNESFIEIENDFPDKRVSKKKKLSGEKCQDNCRNQSPYEKFKSDAFSILETILNSIDQDVYQMEDF